MPEYRKGKVECVTQGHQGCIRISEKQPNGFWKTLRTEHNVYGRIIRETNLD